MTLVAAMYYDNKVYFASDNNFHGASEKGDTSPYAYHRFWVRNKKTRKLYKYKLEKIIKTDINITNKVLRPYEGENLIEGFVGIAGSLHTFPETIKNLTLPPKYQESATNQFISCAYNPRNDKYVIRYNRADKTMIGASSEICAIGSGSDCFQSALSQTLESLALEIPTFSNALVKARSLQKYCMAAGMDGCAAYIQGYIGLSLACLWGGSSTKLEKDLDRVGDSLLLRSSGDRAVMDGYYSTLVYLPSLGSFKDQGVTVQHFLDRAYDIAFEKAFWKGHCHIGDQHFGRLHKLAIIDHDKLIEPYVVKDDERRPRADMRY